uniref:EF-hand domain-containing protein n=1 Tax=Lepisosteus oculatus TaxID=7918 RepID=W5MYA2_LEPOC
QGIVKNKKKKKLKLTKGEKKLARLERACKDLQAKRDEYEQFLDRMSSWLQQHHQRAVELFSCFDKSGTGLLSAEDFQSGMRDLGIPCVEFQLHLLARLLEKDNSGKIDYFEISTSLQRARLADLKLNKEEEGVKEADHLVITRETLERCPVCQLALWKPSAPIRESSHRFLLLNLRLIAFDGVRSHPGHFEDVVPSSIKVYGLINRIQGRVGIGSIRLKIFKDNTYSQESILSPAISLEESGLVGGPPESPTQVTLYYDYSVEFADCSIINCDHYFGRHFLER